MQELHDARWRLQNLYSIKCEQTGRKIPFVPRPEQTKVIDHLLDHPDVPLYIIKSRRLGMSTTLGVFMADHAVFNSGFKGSLIDQTQADAHRKMADIIRFGVMSLPQPMLDTLEFPKRNDGEMTILTKGQPDTSLSTVYAGMNARGGTANMLWISEWGPIAATDFTRSREIRTGALPSARQGRRIVETTWYGGKGGDLWDLIRPILEHDPNAEGRLFFFPWHGDPECVKTTGEITKDIEDYFKDIGERVGRKFAPEQKKWYAARKIEQGIFIKREYPSTLEEAMSAPVEGSIYGDAITALRDKGRICPMEPDGTCSHLLGSRKPSKHRDLVRPVRRQRNPIDRLRHRVRRVSGREGLAHPRQGLPARHALPAARCDGDQDLRAVLCRGTCRCWHPQRAHHPAHPEHLGRSQPPPANVPPAFLSRPGMCLRDRCSGELPYPPNGAGCRLHR